MNSGRSEAARSTASAGWKSPIQMHLEDLHGFSERGTMTLKVLSPPADIDLLSQSL
jgi:hypothetical protein